MPVEIDRSGRRACTPRLGPSTSSAPRPQAAMGFAEAEFETRMSEPINLCCPCPPEGRPEGWSGQLSTGLRLSF